MGSSDEDVRRAAALAHVDIDDEAAASFVAQIGEILEYVAMIDRLDLDGVPPTGAGLSKGQPLREDRVEPSLDREEAMRNAPVVFAGQFVVPRVLGG